MTHAAVRRPKSPTYQLVMAKLGRDPLDYIHELRTQNPPVPYVKIAHRLRLATGVEPLTHELPRRWYVASGLEQRSETEQAA